jgi:hypothetical protein
MSILRELEREAAVLTFLKREGRSVTLHDVALNCSLRIVDAVSVLNGLTTRGVCVMDVSEEGELLYYFPSLNRSASAPIPVDEAAG